MIAEHVSSELGEKITVIATGGPAWKIAAASRSIHEINENLTLQGLEYISRRNQTTRLYSKIPDRRRVDQHGVRNIERVGLTAGGGVMPFGS